MHAFALHQSPARSKHSFKGCVKSRIKRIGDRSEDCSLIVEGALMTGEIEVLVGQCDFTWVESPLEWLRLNTLP